MRPPDWRQRMIWVLWPAFLVACAATGVFFTLFDPMELVLFGRTIEPTRVAIYTMGFFGFWLVGALASGLTVFLQRSPFEVNRCPVPVDERPPDCRDENGGV
jgi:hypothetical protein